jgi:hypothetical protein
MVIQKCNSTKIVTSQVKFNQDLAVNYKHLVIHNYTQFFILFSGKIHFAHRPKSMGEGGCDKNSSLENQELEGKLKARS